MIIKIQATYLAIYICFCLISLQYFLFLNYKFYSVLKKITFIFLICYFIFFLSLLASRTAIAAFILISFSGIIYHFYSIKKVFTGIGILGISSALLVTIFLQNPFIKERILHAFGAEQQLNWINQYGDGHSNPAEDRKIMWKSVWNAGKENWIFGVGTGDTEEKLLEEYSKVNFKAGIDAQYNAHSQFLQTWFELGLIGLIAFISCLIYPAIHAIKEKNVLCLSFLSLVFISCITEAMLERQHGIVFFSLFISLFGFHSLHTKENFK
jgi:O-antigen ligase